MNVRFPLADVAVRKVSKPKRVESPLYAESYWQMNQQEFAMQIEDVADFYACNGSEIEYAPAGGAVIHEIELYLNGSVYGAILHQRKLLPFHGSSFRYNGMTVLVCGDAGAGKSSLTASFCLNGAEFLTDDVTPVIFREGNPYIWALSDRMKLWGDTLRQLETEADGLQNIFRRTDKYYVPMERTDGDTFSLDLVLFIEISAANETSFEELAGAGRFSALRSEIYRAEYLEGMPENEPLYFSKLLNISRHKRMIRIRRPAVTKIAALYSAITRYIE